MFFFRHYMTELQNPNIAALFKRHGARGYGLYWYLMERLYSKDTNTLTYNKDLEKELAKALRMPCWRVRTIVKDLEVLRLVEITSSGLLSSSRVDYEVKEVRETMAKKRG
jgi:hypothetical protein